MNQSVGGDVVDLHDQLTGNDRQAAMELLEADERAATERLAGARHAQLAARVANALQAELVKVLATPDVEKRFNGTGNEVAIEQIEIAHEGISIEST